VTRLIFKIWRTPFFRLPLRQRLVRPMLEVEIQSVIARCPPGEVDKPHSAEGRIAPVGVDIANGLWRQRVEVSSEVSW
jgi:hypothetical protein